MRHVAKICLTGLDLRELRLLAVKDELSVKQASRFHYRKCDVSNEQQVIDTFAWIDKQLGGADVLVNNAGIIRPISLPDQLNSRDVRATVDINVLGVAWCTREAFLSLQCRKVNDACAAWRQFEYVFTYQACDHRSH